MKRLNFYYFFIALFALLISGCQKTNIEEEILFENETEKLLGILKETGINPSDEDLEITDSEFIIEGDMVIPFSYLYDFEQRKSLKSVEQYKYPSPYYCSQSNVSDVAIYINSDVPNGWKKNTRAAITAWNNINGTRIYMREVSSSGSSDIVIRSTYANENWVARANPPYNGRTGTYVEINTKYNSYSASKKKNTMAHELGHSIGFAHTNGTSNFCTPVHIEGTKTTEAPNSVMYRYTHDWTGFTNHDKIAAQTVYPN